MTLQAHPVRIEALGCDLTLATTGDPIEKSRRMADVLGGFELTLASRVLPATGLYVDANAGEGWAALPFASAFPDWQVLCFEADATRYALLQSNIATLGLTNVHCVQAGFHPGLEAPADLTRRRLLPDGAHDTVLDSLPSSLRTALQATTPAPFQTLSAIPYLFAPLDDGASDIPGQERQSLPALPLAVLAALAPELLSVALPGAETALAEALRPVEIGCLISTVYGAGSASAFLPAAPKPARALHVRQGAHAMRSDIEDSFASRRPWLDIVVALYNSERFILPCIDSLLAGGTADVRVLVVDDGSTDEGPLRVAERYAGSDRVRLVRKPNGGCASARNFGRAASNARHIAFVDADDCVTPGYFEQLLDVARVSGANVVEGGFATWTQDGDGQDHFAPIPETEYYAHRPMAAVGPHDVICLEGTDIATGQPAIWRRVYRRDFLDRYDITFPEHVRAFDDQLFQLRVAHDSPEILHVLGGAYHYRQHPDQDIKQGDERHLYSFDMFRSFFEMLLFDKPYPPEPAMQSLLNTMAWSYAQIRPDLQGLYTDAAAAFLARMMRACDMHLPPEAIAATGIVGFDLVLERHLHALPPDLHDSALVYLSDWRWSPELTRLQRAMRA